MDLAPAAVIGQREKQPDPPAQQRLGRDQLDPEPCRRTLDPPARAAPYDRALCPTTRAILLMLISMMDVKKPRWMAGLGGVVLWLRRGDCLLCGTKLPVMIRGTQLARIWE